jgi:pyruvate kinase
MNRIATRIEGSLEYKDLFMERGFEHLQSRTRAVAHATVQMAYELDAAAIIAPTESGYTAEVISKYRPKAAIVAYTPDERAVRQLNLRWGVYPILGSQWSDVNEMTSGATSAAVKHDYVKRGDCTIITSGIKTSEGNTNSIRIYTI